MCYRDIERCRISTLLLTERNERKENKEIKLKTMKRLNIEWLTRDTLEAIKPGEKNSSKLSTGSMPAILATV